MRRRRRQIDIIDILGILFLLYFGSHLVYGYYYCEYSEYANCPGYLINNDPGSDPVLDDEEDVIEDE